MLKKLLATLSLTIAAGAAFANEYWNVNSGGTTMKFLSMQVSPRSAALSGAGVADPGRVSEVTRNPLAMSVASDPEFGINQIIFDRLSSDKFTSIYYGAPVGEHFAASGSVDFLGYDDLEGRDENGLETGSFGAYAWALQAGFGSRNKIFNWGLTARFASQTIDDETGYAIMGDIGGSFKVNKYLVFGATATNVGFATAYDEANEYTPRALQAGITGMIPFSEKWDLHISADAYRRADTSPQWLFGGELSYAQILKLRGGYAIRYDSDFPETESGISCGLGIVFGMIVFDYGYSPRPDLESSNHYLSIGLKF